RRDVGDDAQPDGRPAGVGPGLRRVDSDRPTAELRWRVGPARGSDPGGSLRVAEAAWPAGGALDAHAAPGRRRLTNLARASLRPGLDLRGLYCENTPA